MFEKISKFAIETIHNLHVYGMVSTAIRKLANRVSEVATCMRTLCAIQGVHTVETEEHTIDFLAMSLVQK